MDVPSANPAPPRENAGFTFTELLVLLGVVAIVGTIALNALQSAARSKVEALQCMNNHKQLIAAALLYADEFNGLWLPNQAAQTDWVTLLMDWNPGNSDNTNINDLVNPASCMLAPYVHGDPKIFHCPGDNSYVSAFSVFPAEGYRVRSVSMSQAVGTAWSASGCLVPNGPVNGQWLTGFNINTGCQTQWRCYGKSTDFTVPGPAMTWVFSDEHCDSINDATLAMQCAQQGINAGFIDKPANYHNGAATISFADGHLEIHKWLGPALGLAPDDFNQFYGSGRTGVYNVQNAADNNDLIWLQKRTSARP